MRKKYIVFFVVMIVIVACSVTVLASKTVFSRRKPIDGTPENPSPNTDHDYVAKLEKRMETAGDKPFTNIPVYSEKELLFANGAISLSSDSCFEEYSDLQFNSTTGLVMEYPTEAVRKRDDKSFYMVYDTDTHFRTFLFFDYALNTYQTPVGYAVVIGSVHTWDDFSTLQIGDSIKKVEEVDDVTKLYEDYFLDYCHYNIYSAQEEEKQKIHSCSLHYLDDGLLKIEYTMKEDVLLIIYNIEYHEDYKMTDHVGRTVDYRILEMDLPK